MTASVVVVMGVSGAGKTTIGRRLADTLGWDFAEGDDLHPAASVAKMESGEPLTDADRKPWLELVAAWIDGEISAGRRGVITCSALKRTYRDVLRRPEVLFAYLAAPRAELGRRLTLRTKHFMPASLLDSQLTTLEPPAADEAAIVVAAHDPQQAVKLIRKRLSEAGPDREPSG